MFGDKPKRPDDTACRNALAYVDDALAQTQRSIAEYKAYVASQELQVRKLEEMREIVVSAMSRAATAN